jgi:hypothetical protein
MIVERLHSVPAPLSLTHRTNRCVRSSGTADPKVRRGSGRVQDQPEGFAFSGPHVVMNRWTVPGSFWTCLDCCRLLRRCLCWWHAAERHRLGPPKQRSARTMPRRRCARSRRFLPNAHARRPTWCAALLPTVATACPAGIAPTRCPLRHRRRRSCVISLFPRFPASPAPEFWLSPAGMPPTRHTPVRF